MVDSLSRIDLNLLVAFQVLLEEKNVARATERLYISQSGMSRTLGRLRQVFDDELFIRKAQGLQPTTKAEALADPVAQALKIIQGAVTTSPFEPSHASGEIHLGIPEPLSVFVVPELARRIKSCAPQLILKSHSVVEDYCDKLEAGALDFVVYQRELRDGIDSQLLGHFDLVCLMRKGHPLASKESLSESDFFNTDHILYTLPLVHEEQLVEFVDRSLHHADNRHCFLETTQLMMAVEALLQTDALALLPPGTAELCICEGKLVERTVSDLAINERATKLYLAQHKRHLNSPLHQWLAEQVRSVVAHQFPLKPVTT